jgi:hypothetical protein
MLIYEKEISKYITDCNIAICNYFSCNATKHISNKKNLIVYTYYFDVNCNEDRFSNVHFLDTFIDTNIYICSYKVVLSNANLKLSNRVCWLKYDFDIQKYYDMLNNIKTVPSSIDRYKKL